LPATLPSGIHLDDWNLLGVPDGPKTGSKLPTNYSGTSCQQMQGSFTSFSHIGYLLSMLLLLELCFMTYVFYTLAIKLGFQTCV
jgi:hypothetical protein